MTSISAPRFRLALAALFIGTLLLTFALVRAIAHAAAGPVVTATAGVDTAVEVWRTDGPIWAGLLVLYVGLRTFLNRQHWLARGRLLAVLTGAAAVLAAVLAWKFDSAPLEGVWTALVAAIALIQHPTLPAGQPSSASDGAGAGAAGLLLLALLGAGVTLAPACHAPQHAQHALIDCVGGDAPGIVTNVLETLSTWNRDVADGGCRVPAEGSGSGSGATGSEYDWDCIEAAAVAKGLQVGGCALAEFVQSYLAPPAGRAAPRGAASVMARATLEKYRREQAGGATFRTARGDL